MRILCKNCGSDHYQKNGKVRGKQRYKCKACGLNFVEGDEREKVRPEGKALAALLYGRGKSSYGFIARLFNVSRPAGLKGVRQLASRLPEPTIEEGIKEVQFDEMWHFLNEKNKNYGSGEQWIVAPIEPWDGLPGIVLLNPLKSSTSGLTT